MGRYQLPKAIVGNNIKRIRREKGLSGSELANLLLYSQQHVSRIEQGVVRLHLAQIISIANRLEVNVNELLSGVGFQEHAPHFKKHIDHIECSLQSYAEYYLQSEGIFIESKSPEPFK